MTITTSEVSHEQAQRFYDRLRERVVSRVGEKSASLLLLVPDVFLLLWRLLNDSRVNGANKVLLGSGVAYYFLPLDVVPELFLGPIGFVDDLSKEGGFIGKSPQGKAKALLERPATETGGKAYFPKTSAELPSLA